jgi:hypothetical protein
MVIDVPVIDLASGTNWLFRSAPVVMFLALKYDRVCPVGRFQVKVADVASAAQEYRRFVGGGICSKQETLVPPFEPLQFHVHLGACEGRSELFALVPVVQL